MAEELALQQHSIGARGDSDETQPWVDGPLTVIEATDGRIGAALRGALRYGALVWRYRELLYFMTLRDVKVRYKQTSIGVLWIILQPLWTMLLFTFVFGHVAKLSSGNLPYPLFSYSGLLPWQLFASGAAGAGLSIVGNGGILSKIYFPRAILPIGRVVAPAVDFCVAFIVLIGLMVWYRKAPGFEVVLLPAFLVFAMLTALGVGLWLSMLNVRYRDVQAAIPFALQAWLYLTPVAWALSVYPEWLRVPIELNPMTTVVGGVRWSLLQEPWHFGYLQVISILITVVAIFSGFVYFRRSERTFVDII